jgi:hypothetical protein
MATWTSVARVRSQRDSAYPAADVVMVVVRSSNEAFFIVSFAERL